jgi:hypothetical protein
MCRSSLLSVHAISQLVRHHVADGFLMGCRDLCDCPLGVLCSREKSPIRTITLPPVKFVKLFAESSFATAIRAVTFDSVKSFYLLLQKLRRSRLDREGFVGSQKEPHSVKWHPEP